MSALAIAAAVALAVVWLPNRGTPVREEAVGVLAQTRGEVCLAEAGAEPRAAGDGTSIAPGDSVRTRGLWSTAVLVLADGSRLTIVGDTAITCSATDANRIVVERGLVAAEVEPQPPEDPLVLETPHASVRVVGTEFLLEATSWQTDSRNDDSAK